MIFRRPFSILGCILFLTVQAVIPAQDNSLDIPPGLRNSAIIMDITARVIGQNQKVAWDFADTKVTISGTPVILRLANTNIIIAIQFTPFFPANGESFLVAQGQVWINKPGEGLSFHTSLQTIPIDFEEQIYFFPLGTEAENSEDELIEIEIALFPYSEETLAARRGKSNSR